MHKVLDGMARVGQLPLHALSPEQARAQYAGVANVLEPASRGVQRIEDHRLRCRDGAEIAVRLYADSHGKLPILVYFHGGGFVVGSVDTHDGLCRRLSHLAQCAVISVNYRLAPEFKFPTAHNDACDALQWVEATADALGLDGARVAVGGDSAGGTLATACAIEAAATSRELQLQVLFYPGCAVHANTPSHQKFKHGFVLEAAHIAYFFGHYLESERDRKDWRFAPLDGVTPSGDLADLSRVAPVWIGLAECDPLVDEGVAYADRLRMEGVPVELEIYRGVVHEFIKMGRAIPEANAAIADAARALKAAFGQKC